MNRVLIVITVDDERVKYVVIRRLRSVREDGVLRDIGEPGGVLDDEAARRDGGIVPERQQLGRHRLAHAHPRRLRRRRPPWPLLDFPRLLRHLPHCQYFSLSSSFFSFTNSTVLYMLLNLKGD